MSDPLHEILPRIPAWRHAQSITIRPLAGGATNKNYRVEVDGELFVVRLSGPNTPILGINRAHEHTATTLAASCGIAPAVVAFLQPEGHLVTRFIEGVEWSWIDIRQPQIIERIAQRVHQMHTLPAVSFSFSPFRYIEHYLATAKQFEVAVPPELPRITQHMERIEALEQANPWPLVFCHNDLVRRNFLDDGTVRILDWEYAGMNTPFFDLAIVSENHQFTEEQEQMLLRAYFGSVDSTLIERTRRMKELFLLRDATWSLIQSSISDSDFDFLGYADHLFRRLTRCLDKE
jgi:thiamine kinase-like enzyme